MRRKERGRRCDSYCLDSNARIPCIAIESGRHQMKLIRKYSGKIISQDTLMSRQKAENHDSQLLMLGFRSKLEDMSSSFPSLDLHNGPVCDRGRRGCAWCRRREAATDHYLARYVPIIGSRRCDLKWGSPGGREHLSQARLGSLLHQKGRILVLGVGGGERDHAMSANYKTIHCMQCGAWTTGGRGWLDSAPLPPLPPFRQE